MDMTLKDIVNVTQTTIPYLTTLIRNEDDSQVWCNFMGTLFEHSVNMDWKILYPNPLYIKLPNYPFDNKVSPVPSSQFVQN
jgi:acyl transferase domain-containing protein